MSSEKIKRYGIGTELDGYGRLCSVTLKESKTGKVCKYSDVEALEEERDGYKSAWENMNAQHEKNLSQLSQVTEERDRAVALLERVMKCNGTNGNVPTVQAVDNFLASLTKENE